MGFFRRNVPEPRMGITIDWDGYQIEIGNGSRPGLPHDGRYWVAMVETDEKVFRLIWERAANYQEVKGLLKDFEKTYGKKPKNFSQVRIDDVSGIWYAEPRGKPRAILSVTHPVVMQYPQYQ